MSLSGAMSYPLAPHRRANVMAGLLLLLFQQQIGSQVVDGGLARPS